MQDKIQTKQLIIGAALLLIVGLILLTFWIGVRPFNETRATRTTAQPAGSPTVPQSARDAGYQACLKSDGMKTSFTTAQAESFCGCAADKLVQYNGQTTDEQQTAITMECLAASGAA